jgi:hypothetical protein
MQIQMQMLLVYRSRIPITGVSMRTSCAFSSAEKSKLGRINSTPLASRVGALVVEDVDPKQSKVVVLKRCSSQTNTFALVG